MALQYQFLPETNRPSPPSLLLSTWWERRQRTFLHSWVLDAALITTPETETRSLSASSCLCLTRSSSHSSFFFPLLSFSQRPTTSTVFSISDSMAAYALASQAKLIWHRDCTVFTWHALLQWSHPPTLVTLESTSPLLPKRRPVSIQSPRPSSSCGSPEAAHWPWVQLRHEAGVRRGKEEVTGDF